MVARRNSGGGAAAKVSAEDAHSVEGRATAGRATETKADDSRVRSPFSPGVSTTCSRDAICSGCETTFEAGAEQDDKRAHQAMFRMP